VSVADTGQIDYESATSHTVYIKATSADGSTDQESFTVNVTDANEAGVGAVSDSDATANAVNENVAIGTTVGVTGFATDPDGTDTVTYSLTDDAGGLFAIDANTGVVTVAGAIDRETAASYDIDITATSSDLSTSVQTYTINVNDIDEFDVTTPTDSNAAANTVAEDATNGTAVGVTASASDGDATTNAITYSVVDINGDPVVGGPFAVDANSGVVSVADTGQIDYESATSHTVYIKATSADGSTDQESFTVNVTDAFDEDPTDITYTGGNVNENAIAGTVAATLSTVDADAGDSFTYAITSDPTGYFEIVGNEVRVKAGATIDYETATSHNVMVEVTDAGGNTYSEAITLNVNDLNDETPTDITFTGGSVNENAVAGTVAATLSSVDADASNSFTYAITSDPSGYFEIVGNEVRVKAGATIDYETATSHNVTIEVDDGNGHTYSEAITLNVNDLNDETPTDITFTGGNVNENVVAGTVAATLSSVDADASNSFTYTITSDPSGYFEIVGNEVRVKAGATIDYEAATSHNVTIEVDDGNGHTYSEAITLNVNDIEFEDPTDIRIAHGTVTESGGIIAAGTVVASVASVVDPEANDTFTYALTDDAAGQYTIDASGNISLVANHNVSTADSDTVVVEVTDFGGNTYSETIGIQLGTTGDDTLNGTTNDDVIYGLSGTDTLWGGAGDDTLVAGDSGAPVPYDTEINALNPVAYYRLGESSGTSVVDETGTHNGTYANGVALGATGGLTGNSDTAADFDGSNDEVVISDHADFDITDGTLSFWFNPDVVNTNQVLFSKSGDASTVFRLTLTSGGFIEFETGNGSQDKSVSTTTTFNTGQWYQVTASWGASGMKIYVDGQLEDSAVGTTSMDGSNDIFIGSDSGSVNFDGTIDELAIFDTVLTQSEITDVYDVGTSAGNILSGGDGNDTLVAGSGLDNLDGGAGTDTAVYSDSTAAVNVDLNSGTGTGGDAESDTFTSIENVTGSDFNDTLTGNAGSNILIGGAGDDTLVAGDGGGDSYDTEINALNPVAYYRLGESSGTTAVDETGSHNGTYVNGVTLGVSGGVSGDDTAASFDGANDELVISDHTDLDITDGTISFWFNPDTIGSTQVLFQKDGQTSSFNITLNTGGFIDFETGNGSADKSVSTTTTFNTGQWYQVTASWGASGMKIYVDGQLEDSAVGTTGLEGNNDAFIGSDGSSAHFDGSIDELAIFDTVLTQSEITDVYDSAPVLGGAGDVLIGGAGADSLDGGAGTDTAVYSDSTAGVTVNLATGTGTGGDAEGDTLTSIENITGSDYDDNLTGDANANVLDGGLGDDTLLGGDGSDTFVFWEGHGADNVQGGQGASWTDNIELHDATGGSNIGTYGTDWTLTLSEGSIDTQDANSITLTDDADGTITLQDGSTIDFFDIERIDF